MYILIKILVYFAGLDQPKWAVIACFGYDWDKVFTVQKVKKKFMQKYYKFASKYIKIRNLWLTKFPVTPMLQRLIFQKMPDFLGIFLQTVGLQKNLPTENCCI